MIERHAATVFLSAIFLSCAPSGCLAQANQFNSGGTQGTIWNTTSRTDEGATGMGSNIAAPTQQQSAAFLPTSTALLAPGGLPVTNLDSLVYQAGGSAEPARACWHLAVHGSKHLFLLAHAASALERELMITLFMAGFQRRRQRL